MGCFCLNTDGVVLKLNHGAGVWFAFDVESHIDGDFFTLANNDQVEVLNDLANRVALNVFDQDKLVAICHFELEQCVRATSNKSCFVRWHGNVEWL